MARKRDLAALPVLPDLGYPQCAWEADGRRCRYPGTLSHVTLASADTPFYCGAHFDCSSPAFGAQVVEASENYQHPTREERDRGFRTQRFDAPSGAGFLAWAHRIMARIASGDRSMGTHAEQCARQALGSSAPRREPGEDE